MASQFNSTDVVASAGIRPVLTSIYTGNSLTVNESGGGGIVQIVDNTYTGQTLIGSPTSNAYNEFSSGIMDATITPKNTNNGILIYVRFAGELYQDYNTLFGIKRNGAVISDPADSRLGSYAPGSNQNRGITPGRVSYSVGAGNNYNTTPSMADFYYYDLPQSNQALTYRLIIRQNNGQAIYLNRTRSDSNTNTRERLTSCFRLFEICRVV